MARLSARDPASAWDPGRENDERVLAEGLIAGEQAAIDAFLERTHRPVYAMACRLTTDPDLRHDWSHTVLLKILDDLGRGAFVYRRPGSFWSWFQVRSRFLLINQYRGYQQQHARWTAGEIGEELMQRLPVASTAGPAALVERLEALDALERCLAHLDNEDQRQALRLLLLEDCSYQEVADRLGAPLNTVRSWIRRARISVRRCLLKAFGYSTAD